MGPDMTNPVPATASTGFCSAVSDGADLLGLRTLLALGNLELDPLVLLQGAVAARLDRGEVHEHVGSTAVHGDEAEALFGVEPLDGSLRHVSLLQEGVPAARAAGHLAVFEQRRLLPITSSGAGAVHVHKNSAKNTRSPPPWGNPSLRGKIHESRG